MIDACRRAHASQVNVVLPYYGSHDVFITVARLLPRSVLAFTSLFELKWMTGFFPVFCLLASCRFPYVSGLCAERICSCGPID